MAALKLHCPHTAYYINPADLELPSLWRSVWTDDDLPTGRRPVPWLRLREHVCKAEASKFIYLFIYGVFSRIDTVMVIWRLPVISGGGRPHTYEYRNIRMY